MFSDPQGSAIEKPRREAGGLRVCAVDQEDKAEGISGERAITLQERRAQLG